LLSVRVLHVKKAHMWWHIHWHNGHYWRE